MFLSCVSRLLVSLWAPSQAAVWLMLGCESNFAAHCKAETPTVVRVWSCRYPLPISTAHSDPSLILCAFCPVSSIRTLCSLPVQMNLCSMTSSWQRHLAGRALVVFTYQSNKEGTDLCLCLLFFFKPIVIRTCIVKVPGCCSSDKWSQCVI